MLHKITRALSFQTLPSLIQRFQSSSSPTQRPRICILHSHDIYWNLALEEYYYESLDMEHPTLLLYRDEKSVIIGRHQNPWKECAIQEMRRGDVAFCRRKSGGGAVYHDLGNSCYSFLTPVPMDVLPLNVKVDNNKVLVRALGSLGIETELSERNDVYYNGKKVSGSAYQASLGKRDGTGRKTLHHGTMLLNADLQSLRRYLNPKKEKLVSKGVDSVRASVTNLIEARADLTHEMFCDAVMTEFLKLYPDCEHTVTEYTQEDMERIDRVRDLRKELVTWEWQFQKTPEFTNELEKTFDWGSISISVKVTHGTITEATVTTDSLYSDLVENIREIFANNKIVYDEHGCRELIDSLRKNFDGNTLYEDAIIDLEDWLPKAI